MHPGESTLCKVGPHPWQAVDDSTSVVLDKVLSEGQLLLIAIIYLNPIERVHGLQTHCHLVSALHSLLTNFTCNSMPRSDAFKQMQVHTIAIAA